MSSKTEYATHSSPPILGPVGQIGILVEDISAALVQYTKMCGIEKWLRYTYDRKFVPEMLYRGQPGRFAMHIALSAGMPQIELIQPLAGPSIYEEHLRRYGYSMHHLGIFVPSLAAAAQKMSRLGYQVIQLGRGYGVDGDGGFAYFDTEESLGLVIEAIEIPRRRYPPLQDWSSFTEV